MPADPIADFLLQLGVDPEALVLAFTATVGVLCCAWLVHAAAKGIGR